MTQQETRRPVTGVGRRVQYINCGLTKLSDAGLCGCPPVHLDAYRDNKERGRNVICGTQAGFLKRKHGVVFWCLKQGFSNSHWLVRKLIPITSGTSPTYQGVQFIKIRVAYFHLSPLVLTVSCFLLKSFLVITLLPTIPVQNVLTIIFGSSWIKKLFWIYASTQFSDQFL